MAKLGNYNPTNKKRIESKEEEFDNARQLFEIRSKIIKAFEGGTIPLHKKNG